MTEAVAFPQPVEADSEDVSWALSTGQAMWTRGDTAEAVRWVKRASDSAADAGDDDRALSLARAAAELKLVVGGSVAPPPAPPAPPAPTPPPPPVASATATPIVVPSAVATAPMPDVPPPAPAARRQTTPPVRPQTSPPARPATNAPPARPATNAPPARLAPIAGGVRPVIPPSPAGKIPLPTAGVKTALQPARRAMPAPKPAVVGSPPAARATPTTVQTSAPEMPARAEPPPVSAAPFDRETHVPDGTEAFPRHEAPTASGPSSPPARGSMPTPTEIVATKLPPEAYADSDDEDFGSGDDSPTAAFSSEAMEAIAPAPAPAPVLAPAPALAPAASLASVAVWLVRAGGDVRVVAATGSRPAGAVDAVVVATSADLTSVSLGRLRPGRSGAVAKSG